MQSLDIAEECRFRGAQLLKELPVVTMHHSQTTITNCTHQNSTIEKKEAKPATSRNANRAVDGHHLVTPRSADNVVHILAANNF
jgi:hypothetical protein